MTHLYWWIANLGGLWIEIVLSNYVRIAGLKINIVLIVLLILMLRWKSPFLLFYGLILGMMVDTLSHAMVGVNGLSFFLTLILTRWVSDWFYDRNVVSTMILVGVLSFIEGAVALTLFKLLDPEFLWHFLFFQVVSPLAFIHGLLSPLFLIILIRFERFLHLRPEGQSSSSLRH